MTAAILSEPALPAAREARLLVRAARAGVLATQADGQPANALITPATAPDGSLLMFLSTLSAHTRQLRADPRCAVLVQGDPVEANPQTAPRVSLEGEAREEPDPAMKARWLAIHPYAALYAEFADFTLFRLVPAVGRFVGGFARAHRLAAADLLVPPDAVAAIGAAAGAILAHCNTDHADALAAIAGTSGAWRMVAIDADGCDLGQGAVRTRRIAWPSAVADADAIRRALIDLARTARAA